MKHAVSQDGRSPFHGGYLLHGADQGIKLKQDVRGIARYRTVASPCLDRPMLTEENTVLPTSTV